MERTQGAGRARIGRRSCINTLFLLDGWVALILLWFRQLIHVGFYLNMLVSSSLVYTIVLAMVVQVSVDAGISKSWIPPPLYINVHYTVFCGHQGVAIMPGIETVFECTILFSFTFTFEIRDCAYWSGSAYHTFYKIGCLSVQNIPPSPQVLVPPLKNPICTPDYNRKQLFL